MTEARIAEDDAQRIIDALDGYNLPEQVGCLISLLFSHVSAACGHNMGQADTVMQRILQSIPHQWAVTRGMIEMELMSPTSPLH